MIGHHFQHDLIRKHVIVFGTLFNNIYITRKGNQAFKVPIEYGPREKWVAITQGKPGAKKKAIQLPRLSYELTGMSYDSMRKLNRSNMILNNGKQTVFGNPWNYHFRLNAIAMTQHDAAAIVEQALMYFSPDYTVDVKLLNGFDHIDRIPVVYNNVMNEDIYEGSIEAPRILTWSLDFTVKSRLYGVVDTDKLIKFIDTTIVPHQGPTIGNIGTKFTLQPGLTEEGEPTTDINQTVPFGDINLEDDWDIILQRFDLGSTP